MSRGRSKRMILSDSNEEPPRRKKAYLRPDPNPPKRQKVQASEAPKQGKLTFVTSAESATDKLNNLALKSPSAQRTSRRQTDMKQDGGNGAYNSEHSGGELWSVKHQPQRESDLVVHKRKVLEVKEFLEHHAENPTNVGRTSPMLLLLTGPPGSGKTSTVHVVAKGLGFNVTEWEAPVPTLWSEYLAQGDREQAYVSKLDEFVSFVSHAKLAPLKVTSISNEDAGCSHQPQKTLIIVDDLPDVASAEQQARLINALCTLAETSCSPVIVTMTTSFSSEQQTGGSGLSTTSSILSRLSKALTAAGGINIAFNPITPPNAAKVLRCIAQAEGFPLEPEKAQCIAKASGGDLLNAIGTLQLFRLGRMEASLPKRATGGRQVTHKGTGRGKKVKAPATPTADLQALQRDVNLNSFHALAKFLYNKREGDKDAEPAAQPAPLNAVRPLADSPHTDRLARAAMTFNPEDVLMASGMEPAFAAAFLHENYLDFVAEDAIEDVATAANYLSDADLLLSHGWASRADVDMDTLAAGSNIVDACGGSVACRGLMWANAHPAPPRWRQLKGPMEYKVNRARQENSAQLQQVVVSQSSSRWGSSRQIALDFLPYMRVMSSLPRGAHAAALLPRKWCHVWGGEVREEERQPVLADIAGYFEDSEEEFDEVEDSEDDT